MMGTTKLLTTMMVTSSFLCGALVLLLGGTTSNEASSCFVGAYTGAAFSDAHLKATKETIAIRRENQKSLLMLQKSPPSSSSLFSSLSSTLIPLKFPPQQSKRRNLWNKIVESTTTARNRSKNTRNIYKEEATEIIKPSIILEKIKKKALKKNKRNAKLRRIAATTLSTFGTATAVITRPRPAFATATDIGSDVFDAAAAAGSGSSKLVSMQTCKNCVGSILALLSSISTFNQQNNKIVTKSILALASAIFYIRLRQQQKRQSIDATSEWGRYATHPMTRGRALSSLMMMQVLPLWFCTTIVQQYEKVFNRKNKDDTSLSSLSSKLSKRTGDVLSNGLLRIGPLYIKLGQIISCRDDLLPSEWVTSLEKLQDSVPAKSGQDAYELIYAAMDGKQNFDDVFESFDPNPIAAASLGQVHKAILKPKYRLSSSKQQKQSVSESSSATNNDNSDNKDFSMIMDGFFKTFQEMMDQSPMMNKINGNDSSVNGEAKAGVNNEDSSSSVVDVDVDDDGTVAVKIQRSYLREIYDQDFAFLSKIARIMDKFGGATQQVGGIQQSWTNIFDDAKEIMFREIDYRDEADNGIKFIKDFGLTVGGKPAASSSLIKSLDNETVLPSAAEWIRAPYVYRDVCREKLLVMEYVPSIKITNEVKLNEANVTVEEREYLADMLARSYLRQFTCNLFFSTDPHPGNLGVEILYPSSSSSDNNDSKKDKDKKRVRLVFYDFGQAATLNRNQGDGIVEIMEAIIDMDVDNSITAFQKMGVLKEDADLNKVRTKISSNYKEGKIKANTKKLKSKGYYEAKQSIIDANNNNANNANATVVAVVNGSNNATLANTTTTTSGNNDDTKKTNDNKVSDTEVMGYFTLPAEYAFVGRALTQMDGVGKTLDPDFDFISSSAPYIVEIKGTGKYIQDELSKFWKNLVVNS